MADRSSITGSVPAKIGKPSNRNADADPLLSTTATPSQLRLKQEQDERRVKKLFFLTLAFKVCAIIIDACLLAFAAESTPNIDIFDCNYDHRPGFVAFYIVVHSFFFCVMIFLLCYQLFYQLKEKAMVPQRVMDLFALIALIILTSIALACYAIWVDDTLNPYLDECNRVPLPKKECITEQTCDMFKSMKAMAVGALFWGSILLILNVIFTVFLGCVVGRKLMEMPEGRVLYKKMQEESNMDVSKKNENANNPGQGKADIMQEDDDLGYGGKGLVLLQFPRPSSDDR